MRLLTRLRSTRRRAFSVLEVMVTLTIVTISLGMFAQTMASSKKLDPIASETAIAASAARTMLEQMKNHDFSDVWVLYNANPNDDPDGPGTAPGPNFAVPDLQALTPGALAGSISFPTTAGQIREDVIDPPLGMPRDLNSDDVVDAADHTEDFVLLPIRVRIDWISKGTRGTPRRFEMFTMYTSFTP